MHVRATRYCLTTWRVRIEVFLSSTLPHRESCDRNSDYFEVSPRSRLQLVCLHETRALSRMPHSPLNLRSPKSVPCLAVQARTRPFVADPQVVSIAIGCLKCIIAVAVTGAADRNALSLHAALHFDRFMLLTFIFSEHFNVA